MFLGCVVVYAALFATGSFIYGNDVIGGVLAVVSAGCLVLLARLWKRF